MRVKKKRRVGGELGNLEGKKEKDEFAVKVREKEITFIDRIPFKAGTLSKVSLVFSEKSRLARDINIEID